MPKAHGPPHLPPAHQPDAYVNQVNPVSGQWYTVLDTTPNVRIITIFTRIFWATTQPTPLEVRVTIDGNLITHIVANPVTATEYFGRMWEHTDETNQGLVTTSWGGSARSFLYEGRSVKVEVRITWAITQPTRLECRVKYAKW